ncbi:MAG: PTS fructose transporter subunit IIABC [Brevinema sp.]
MDLSQIQDIISLKNISINANFKNKESYITYVAKELSKQGICTNQDQFIKDVLEREKSGTDLEEGIAIPHAKSSTINKTTVFAATLASPWENTNGSASIKLVFLLAIPTSNSDEHIKIISMLSTAFLQEGLISKLTASQSPEEFMKILSNHKKSSQTQKTSAFPEIIAVTACPVGVAHTYVAAEKLKHAAEELGINIKVETNGSIGVENALTDEEISHAKCVILACDRAVETERFKGKYKIEVSVADAISKAKNIITDASKIDLSKTNINNSSIQHNDKKTNTPETKKTPFYRYLMGGVGAIIPLVVVGGVYIALAIALSGVKANTGIEITNPLLQKMEQIGGLAFGLMIPMLAGFIAQSIADRSGLVPGFVGGALAAQLGTGFLGGILAGFVAGYISKQLATIKLPPALRAILPIFIVPLIGTALTVTVLFIVGSPIRGLMDALTLFLQNMRSSAVILGAIIGAMITFDMGGPVNKVAFLFGVSMIQSGVPEIMGMVAVSVCIPPLGVWLATKIRPTLFDEQEREAGNAAFLMGLIGITEGAIPFAVANPLCVIPSLMSGGIIGGMIAAIFKVTDHAPHGGPIVLPVVDNKIGFIIAVIAGMCITALVLITLLSFQKKKETV